jgi:tetratricopeptide (TPR) repeat protein
MLETKRKPKVLLIGWDAADWEVINPLLDEGLMPALGSLIDRGVMANLATLQPILSPMLWNSIATGKFPDKHGIHGFIERDLVHDGARPYTSTSRKCKAIWNIFTQAGLRSNIVGWWASHPAEPINGTVVTNMFSAVKFDPARGWMVPPGTIHPEEKSGPLAQFRVFPTELTEAHILPFIPEGAKIDQQSDTHLSTFAKVLSDAASIHAVGTTLMESEPWDFTALYYDAIDHFSHAFMPFHPPKLEWISEKDFELYKSVVRGGYRFHDMMLERLIEIAGPETTIVLCSDHGFESGSQRPRGTPREPAGPAVWHRQYGILVMAGPGIKQDERIYGASLIDITPTLLTLFGLPIGKDMDGRPLLEAFVDPPNVEVIESWETREGDAGMHAAGKQIDPDQAHELMQQFAALGYIEDPGTDKKKQAESADIEAKYNVSRTYLWKSQPERALPLLEEIVRRRPWEDRFLMHLATCYFRLGYLRQAERVLAALSNGSAAPNTSILLLLAKIKLARGELEGTLETLRAAEATKPQFSGIYTQIGDAYSRLLQWENAKSAYNGALSLDEENALALQGLSTVYRRQGLNQEAVDTALRAVSLLHRLPVAHFNIGVAMARAGEVERAILAFETALRFNTSMLNAHRYLAILYRAAGDSEKAAFHRREANKVSKDHARARQTSIHKFEKTFDLPEIPNQEERFRILLQERPDPVRDDKKSGKTFILVSGLPRSGTSLMMQMLEAGGVRILTDRERLADVDNPKGYYEWEAIKQIAKKPELLDRDEFNGTAIKCISMLLPKMPSKHGYKVIFMMRPIEEVAASQGAMVNRLQRQGAELEPEQLEHGLTAHRDETRSWLRTAPHVQFMEVHYPKLMQDPEAEAQRVAQFLGTDYLPTPEKMSAVIDPLLYRRKKKE